MKKILYLMHLPWDWIKQRPHFLAEELSVFFEIEVVYRFYRVPFEGKLVRNAHHPSLNIRPLVILPFNRFAPVSSLNAKILRFRLRQTIASFDIVWFTHPEMFEAIGSIVPAAAHVVYDCMDNHCAFDLAQKNPELIRRIRICEQALLDRCDTVICSSQALQEMLVNHYALNKPLYLVNNAIHHELKATLPHLTAETEKALSEAAFRLIYVGTIAGWIDLELLCSTLDRFPQVTIFLFGPCEVDLPKHPRLLKMGPVSHGQVFTVMERSDALIMPFQETELVRGVDPVKLYEYVYSGKPSLVVDYPETRKFGEFVHLYKGGNEFFSLVSKLLTGEIRAKKGVSECHEFALANTWRCRAKTIEKLIKAGGVDG